MKKDQRIDTRKDILLLLLYAPTRGGKVNEPITGRTRLVKMLYVFRKEALQHFRRGTSVDENNFYQFFAWNYGPFSIDVYDDLTFFQLNGFIETNASTEDALPESAAEWELWLNAADEAGEETFFQVFQEDIFRLTDKGKKFAEGLWNTLTSEQQGLLIEFKTRFSTAPLRSILQYVYEKYEDMTAKSQIKDDILRKSA